MRFIIALVVVFAVIVGYDTVFHTVLLKDMYMETASLWRGEQDMKLLPMLVGQFVMAVAFCAIFVQGLAGKGVGAGVLFGILAAMFVVGMNLIFYAVQPIPEKLLAAWVAGAVLEFVILGVIVSIILQGRPANNGAVE